MTYPCVTTSIAGFIQQLAVSYCAKGYRHYVLGTIPAQKDPARVDAKLIARYDLNLSYATRSRRKKRGAASVQYVRYNDVYVLIATDEGHHHFLDEEQGSMRDITTQPIHVFGYAIGFRNGHVCVRIAKAHYRKLKKRFLKRATRDTAAEQEAAFQHIQYQPYAPIRSQLLCIFRAVNAKRHACGLPPLAKSCVRLWRRSVLPFGVRRAAVAALAEAA